MAMWMEEPDGRGRYDDPQDEWRSEEVEGYARSPLLRRPLPPKAMTPAEWSAYERGQRWCLRCKEDLAAAAESCDMCGSSAYGRVAA